MHSPAVCMTWSTKKMSIVFDPEERMDLPVVPFQHRSPTFQAFAPGQRLDALSKGYNSGFPPDLDQGLVLHGKLRLAAPR